MNVLLLFCMFLAFMTPVFSAQDAEASTSISFPIFATAVFLASFSFFYTTHSTPTCLVDYTDFDDNIYGVDWLPTKTNPSAYAPVPSATQMINTSDISSKEIVSSAQISRTVMSVRLSLALLCFMFCAGYIWRFKRVWTAQNLGIESGTNIVKTADAQTATIETAYFVTSAIKTTKFGTDAIKTTNSGTDAIKTINSGTDAVKTINSGTDAVETINSGTDAIKTINTSTDAIKITSSGTDAVETANSGTDAIKTTNTGTDAIKTINSGTDAIKTTNIGTSTIANASSGTDIIEAADKHATGKPITTITTADSMSAYVVARRSLIAAGKRAEHGHSKNFAPPTTYRHPNARGKKPAAEATVNTAQTIYRHPNARGKKPAVEATVNTAQTKYTSATVYVAAAQSSEPAVANEDSEYADNSLNDDSADDCKLSENGWIQVSQLDAPFLALQPKRLFQGKKRTQLRLVGKAMQVAVKSKHV